MADLIATVKRPSLCITVYPNRVEIRKRTFWFIFWNNTVVPMRNIASVEAKTATQVLIIKTNDGKTYKYRLGLRGATRIRDAILNAM